MTHYTYCVHEHPGKTITTYDICSVGAIGLTHIRHDHALSLVIVRLAGRLPHTNCSLQQEAIPPQNRLPTHSQIAPTGIVTY
jgi:hypothetical protein